MAGYSVRGEVVDVKEPDLVVIREQSGMKTEVQLAKVQALVEGQELYQEALDFMREKFMGTEVVAFLIEERRPVGYVGEVRVVMDVDLGELLLRLGYALPDPATGEKYVGSEVLMAAVREHLGMWSQERPVAPWEYKKRGEAAECAQE